ncbi:putative dehydropantoate reductase [Teratosphaeria destructans]|uniref:Dehydropantoate reductase n=1 Tax=Teratosphaeria destructans TaxID=418781 RepID=A0A9W7T2I7_9PEZI|nr:putative dehydropantoate reductase [Teratosphaeria destructans]
MSSTLTKTVCLVGGNSVSAFLSWRLSATNACDVTLVWKSGFEAVAQYGISFRSNKFGNERFKPRHVVRTPEEAASTSRASFDYVLLCVKALPDVYDLASVIESVVSPQHTCILVNTTHTLGIESYLEQRFPTNVVLSLVSGAEISQLAASEFEHKGSTDLWVGAANANPSIPASIQTDMAEALAMTLKSGQVDCEVSPNIRQQQYDRMIGPIAFHPASVVFETPSHADLLEQVGVRPLITGVIDELTTLAKAQGCSFQPGFREQIMEQMVVSSDANSTMYQDFTARRPMEVETYLGSPIKIAQEVGLPVPRIETLYALLHHTNVVNQTRPQPTSPAATPVGAPPPPSRNGMPQHPRASSYAVNGGPPMVRGMPPRGPSSRAPSAAGGPPPPMRRGPPSMSGYPPRMNGNGYGPRGPPQQMSRRPSFDGNDLEEFSHLMLYDVVDGGDGYDMPNSSSGDLALRERELALRQKELALREREMHMGGGRRRGPPPPPRGGYDDDDEDGEDYFDPMAGAPMMAPGEVDNLDMMSVTSRRTRKAPSASQLRANPEMMSGMGGGNRGSRNPWAKRPPMKNRTSATLMGEIPNLHEDLMNNPLMGYSSDRYANVDRHNIGQESRTNSLTAERLNELQQGGPRGYGGPPGPPMSRRGSQSPGHPLGPGQRPPPPGMSMQRPSPTNGYGPGPNGRPSPPGMRQPIPRHPPGHGNAVAPQHIEQQTGVSNLYPPKPQGQVRSLTGSASASAGSGDSNRSAPLDSEPSAHSSSSSLGPRPPIGVR